jgi:hypothetical protein
MNFTAADKKLLRSMGIDPGAPDAEKFLVLARQIAKHRAPGQQAKVNPQAAKLQLVKLALRKLLAAEKESE